MRSKPHFQEIIEYTKVFHHEHELNTIFPAKKLCVYTHIIGCLQKKKLKSLLFKEIARRRDGK